jgi:hypothetical protein
MKPSVNVLDSSGVCCRYLTQKSPLLSKAKEKGGVFVGPQTQQLIRDSTFTNFMNDFELQACDLFKDVIVKFLGKL